MSMETFKQTWCSYIVCFFLLCFAYLGANQQQPNYDVICSQWSFPFLLIPSLMIFLLLEMHCKIVLSAHQKS